LYSALIFCFTPMRFGLSPSIGSQVHRNPSIEEWRENSDALFDLYRRKAARSGVKLTYAYVTAFKPSNGEIHGHFLTNWLPSPVSSPTPSHPAHHDDMWLESSAKERGLTLSIEKAQSADAAGIYTAGNLKSTIGRPLPPHFQRVKYSRSWPKLPPREPEDNS
jgi:hypothetical protein